MARFDDYDLAKAQRIISRRSNKNAQAYLAYYNGDHFQNREGWTGPHPRGSDPEQVWALIERAFTSRNVIGEIVDRSVNGVLARELHWKFSVARDLAPAGSLDPVTGEIRKEDEQPTGDEDSLISEATAALVTWVDRMEAQEIFQQMDRAALLTQRGVLRLFVPPGELDDAGNVPLGTIPEQLDRLWLQCLNHNEDALEQQLPSATVYIDKRSRQEIGVFVYQEDEEDGESGAGQERAELCYLDKDKNTVLRIIDSGGDIDDAWLLPLGGRLTLYEMTRRSLVNPQIVSQQKSVNLAETMRGRNVESGGFLERLILNGEMPGEWVPDPAKPGKEKFQRDPDFHVGAGTTNFIYGVPIYDPKDAHMPDEQRRAVGYTTPSAIYREPVSPDTFIRSSDAPYINILREANQLHYAMASDAVVSGESRKQAREAYEADLRITAGKVEAAARWALETVLAMAAYFAGQPGRFEGLRAYVTARVDAGPISADEMRVAAEMRDRGLWDWETAVSRTGVDDVDAIKQRLEKEQSEQLAGAVPGIAELERILAGDRQNGSGNGQVPEVS